MRFRQNDDTRLDHFATQCPNTVRDECLDRLKVEDIRFTGCRKPDSNACLVGRSKNLQQRIRETTIFPYTRQRTIERVGQPSPPVVDLAWRPNLPWSAITPLSAEGHDSFTP